MKPVLIYGSYGYSGDLIVRECIRKGIAIILSGRDATKLKKQSALYNLPFEILDLSEEARLKSILLKCDVVIHCAGPFQYTAKTMALACLETQTHYLDITGEIGVFESLSKLDGHAIKAGIMILPGAGFDVVPTDCLALHLKEKLPTSTHLQLAFAPIGGGPSRGTAKTAAEGFGYGSLIRKDGKLFSVPIGKELEVDFGERTLMTMGIPWGDVATAYRSTGIPNIEVFMAASPKMIRLARASNYLGWLLRSRWIKNLILKRIDKKVHGPSDDRREVSRSLVWGKVWNDQGQSETARLEIPGGYTVTARAAVHIVQKVLAGNLKKGFATAGLAYGSGLISELEGCRWI